MGINVNDVLIGPSQGTVEQARSRFSRASSLRKDEIERYLVEAYRLCQLTGLRYELVVAQFDLETGTATSAGWRDQLNPGGVGITDGNTYAVKGFASGTDSARVQLVHLSLYVLGEVHEALVPYKALDFRIPHVTAAGYLGIVKQLKDLGRGVWATDPVYDTKLVSRANAIFPNLRSLTIPPKETPVTTTEITNRDIPPEGYAPKQFNLATDYALWGLSKAQAQYLVSQCSTRQAEIEGTIWHAQYGYITGSLRHWLGVQASATAMIRQDGAVLWIIPERFRPWTTGDVQGPKANASVLYRGGIIPDHRAVAYEFEGLAGEVFTQQQFWTMVWLARRDMKNHPKMTPDEAHFTGHMTFNNSAEKSVCPNQTNLDRGRKAVMDDAAIRAGKATQPEPTPVVEIPAYAEPNIPDFVVDSTLPTVDSNGTTWRLVTDQYRTIRSTPRLQYAMPTAARIGPDITPGTIFDAAYIGRSATDGKDYLLSPWGSRIKAADCERISDETVAA